jgi:hypothetical protein
MSTVDVKSLFKSGKKTIKAFKVAAGPSADANQTEKSAEDSLEHWEAPVVSQPSVAAVNLTVGMDDYKGQSDEAGMKPSVSWKEAAAVVEEAPKEVVSASAYVPPSQRRAESIKAMPSLAEVAKLASPAVQSKPTTPAPQGRLKLITAASKKAMEEEAQRKEEERLKKEQEKQARKEQLRADLERQASSAPSQVESMPEETTIKAASLSEIYAKYIDRPKKGRHMLVSH